MATADIYNLEARLANIQKRARSCRDAKSLLDFADMEFANGKSRPAVIRYMNALIVISERIDKPIAKLTLKEVVELRRKMERGDKGFCSRSTGRPYSPVTIKDSMLALKVYLKHVKRDDLAKEISIKQIMTTIDAGSLWTENELNLLIGASGDVQNQALVACVVESGCRIGEVGGMTIGSVKTGLPGLQPGEARIDVDGKTGARPILLIWSSSYLLRWLNARKAMGAKPTEPLWTYKDGRQRQYSSLSDTFRKAAKKCGVDKPCNPHIYRKSMTTLLRKKGYDSELIKKRNGWSRSSRMLEIYEAISPDRLYEEERRVNGVKKVEDKPQVVRTCQKCGMVNAPTAMVCGSCGEVVDMAERERRLVASIKQQVAGEMAALLPMLMKTLSSKQVKELQGIEDKDKQVAVIEAALRQSDVNVKARQAQG